METSFGLLVAAFLLLAPAEGQSEGLKHSFYEKSCPQAEQIVQDVIWTNVASNSYLPAKLLRLFFHDCFVRGCDASVLLDSANDTAEKNAGPNKLLAGYEVIEEAKAALEGACPGVVSCADVVALAARDAVSFQFKRSLWMVKTGRRDGRTSLNSEARANIPSPSSNFSTLVSQFANRSLDVADLVILSGAHTIGMGHCFLFSNRLNNFTGRGDADPSLNGTYAEFLRTQCRYQPNITTVPMDPGSATTFDTHYYVNLKDHKGLFQSDAALLTDETASHIVEELLDAGIFLNAFGNSITRMGDVGVLTGASGEIRKKCNVVN